MLLRPADASGDILPVRSSSAMLSGPEAVAQLVRYRLSLLRGEWCAACREDGFYVVSSFVGCAGVHAGALRGASGGCLFSGVCGCGHRRMDRNRGTAGNKIRPEAFALGRIRVCGVEDGKRGITPVFRSIHITGNYPFTRRYFRNRCASLALKPNFS